MTALFSPQGLLSVYRLAVTPSLLAFDLDGTLAPLVPLAANARVPADTADKLRALSLVWPLGVITGRAIEDARPRLGFTPRYLVGNHGAELDNAPASAVLIATLDRCREHFLRHTAAMQAQSITLEDKGLSLALHYTRATNTAMARAWLNALIEPVREKICANHGHCVMNITPANAPDKGDALLDLMHDCKATKALVVGDDVNDEMAFDKAPAGSVTIRIGSSQVPTLARFRLYSQDRVNRLLSVLLSLRR